MMAVGSKWGWIALLLMLLGGCSSVAPPGAPAGQRPPTIQQGPADQRASLPATLAAERQWLQSWFEGTPVVIASRGGRSITVDVPKAHCFDPGRTRVKPALAAVLDKVAQSMRRLPYSALPLIAAPDDGTGNRSLAMQRAAQIHKHLRSAGVPAARLGQPGVTTAAAVQLRIDVEEP
ncbi:MAG: hypothetical protein ABI564_06260 [Ideonella sp.]